MTGLIRKFLLLGFAQLSVLVLLTGLVTPTMAATQDGKMASAQGTLEVSGDVISITIDDDTLDLVLPTDAQVNVLYDENTQVIKGLMLAWPGRGKPDMELPHEISENFTLSECLRLPFIMSENFTPPHDSMPDQSNGFGHGNTGPSQKNGRTGPGMMPGRNVNSGPNAGGFQPGNMPPPPTGDSDNTTVPDGNGFLPDHNGRLEGMAIVRGTLSASGAVITIIIEDEDGTIDLVPPSDPVVRILYNESTQEIVGLILGIPGAGNPGIEPHERPAVSDNTTPGVQVPGHKYGFFKRFFGWFRNFM